MKTAREVASELIGLWFGINDRVIREQLVDRLTDAIESRDREVVGACVGAAEGEYLEDPCSESDGAYDQAVTDCAQAIRSLAPLPGGTK
jgi:hypothetical protein